MLETFFRTHQYLVERIQAPVRRALMDEINWRDRMIGIKGSRGVGKTTFLLQYAKENFGPYDRRCLYINMNNFFFHSNSCPKAGINILTSTRVEKIEGNEVFVSNPSLQGGRFPQQTDLGRHKERHGF